MITIAVDMMGGDSGIDVTVPAVNAFLDKHPDVHVLVYGDSDSLNARFAGEKASIVSRVHIIGSKDNVLMDDQPALALRRKRQSSMGLSLAAVRDGKAVAAVSAGNTGALVAMARYVLSMIPGVDRPAILALFPSAIANKPMLMLDVGADVDLSPKQFTQLAMMGKQAGQAILGHDPTIHILNIGKEQIKGNRQVKQASELLNAMSDIDFRGYIEGDALLNGQAQVVLCDGFVGNVALKSIEGIAKLFQNQIRLAIMRSPLTKLFAPFFAWILRPMLAKLSPSRYNGALLLGLQGVVVKSHGSASIHGFESALESALNLCNHQLVDGITVAIANANQARKNYESQVDHV